MFASITQLSVELIFFGRAGQCGHRRLAALNDGGHLVEVTGTHFLLVCHEGVAPLGGGERFVEALRQAIAALEMAEPAPTQPPASPAPDWLTGLAGLDTRLGLARAMAREFGPDGIRINSITPGLIGTDIIKGKLTEEKKAEIAETIPLARLGRADDIAGACVFLASHASDFVNGQILYADGGILAYIGRQPK